MPKLSSELLSVLRCPVTGSGLVQEGDELVTVTADGAGNKLRYKIEDGIPLLLFPEGTRSRTGEMAAFKPGAAALCISRDVPCLPMAIVGASEAMPYGQNWPSRGRPPVYVAFGEPMRAEDGETVAQFSERITKEVSGLIDYATTYRANHA